MPTVPRVQRQVEVGALPGVRLTPDAPIEAFGGGASQAAVSRSMGGLIATGAEVYERETAKADDAIVQAKLADYKREKIRQLYDPSQGALTRRGQSAFGVFEEYGDKFKKYGDELEGSLNNDRQKAMFRQFKEDQSLEFDGNLRKHVFAESQEFMNQSAKSLIDVEREEAGLNPLDNAKIQSSIRTQEIIIADNAAKNGAPPASTHLMIQDARKKTHTSVIDKLLVGGYFKEAEDHLNRNVQDLGNDALSVRRSIELESARAQKEVKEQLKAVQEKTQGEFLDKLSKGQLRWKDVRDSNLDAFGSGSKEQFMGMIKTNAERPPKTDPGTFRDLFSRVHLPDGDPKKLNDENDLNQYVVSGRLTVDSLNQLRSEIHGKRTPEGEVESDLKKALESVAKGTLTKSNPLLGIKDPEGDEQYLRFMTQFLPEYNSQRKKGKSAQELLNPDSKDYLGKSIRTFTRTPDQIMRSMVGSATPTPVGDPKIEAYAKQNGIEYSRAADILKGRGYVVGK